jgi:hypothetical protein
MTCTNPRCGHDFCWLCLRGWDNPTHDGLQCMMARENTDTAVQEDVMVAVDARIRTNWELQPPVTRPPHEEDYAAEIRDRFRTALATNLASDHDVATVGAPLHLSHGLLRHYEERERLARDAASIAFGAVAASSATRAEALTHIREFVSWVWERWWLRLVPEDVALEDDFLELSRARLRAQHAVYSLKMREASWLYQRARATVASRCLQRLPGAVSAARRTEVLRLVEELLAHGNERADVHGSTELNTKIYVDPHTLKIPAAPCTKTDSRCSVNATGCARTVAAATRALVLAAAASRSWKTNQLLEATGILKPLPGKESAAADSWVEEVSIRRASLGSLLAESQRASEDNCLWEQALTHATEHLNAGCLRVFTLALDYCGGTRRTVRRRGEN